MGLRDLSYREERSRGARIVLDLLFAPVVKVRGLYMSHVATTICEEKLLLECPLRRTLSGGEFGWGGTSVKMQHRCSKGDSVRTETSLRP